MRKSSLKSATSCKTEPSVSSTMRIMKTLTIIDSHTGGEPTRLITSGGPDLGGGPLHEQLAVFRRDFDPFRAGVVNEPRRSDMLEIGRVSCGDNVCQYVEISVVTVSLTKKH